MLLVFGNAQCLHRSLIGFKLVRKWGLPAELVIGVKNFHLAHTLGWNMMGQL